LPQSGKIFVTLDAIQGKERTTNGFGVIFASDAKMMTKPEDTGPLNSR
jgi:hypothetical protein